MFLASPITFPNLGITVDPSPVAFTVFGKDIYWYGIIIASGFLLAGQREPSLPTPPVRRAAEGQSAPQGDSEHDRRLLRLLMRR